MIVLMADLNQEIEVRFLEIDKEKLIQKLKSLNAEDLGEDYLKEVIIYDKEKLWPTKENKFVRIRKNREGIFLSYKHHYKNSATGTKEIEIRIDDLNKAKELMEEIGLVAYREQEKYRHSFKLGEVMIDIDTWPAIPTYVEIEGASEESIQDAAEKLGFDWSKAVFENAGLVIKNYYNINVFDLRYFTFERME
jgi:adenylate cyclase, class 2